MLLSSVEDVAASSGLSALAILFMPAFTDILGLAGFSSAFSLFSATSLVAGVSS